MVQTFLYLAAAVAIGVVLGGTVLFLFAGRIVRLLSHARASHPSAANDSGQDPRPDIFPSRHRNCDHD